MVKMKGISLPIETIVIVAVAVLVLVVVAAFFASGTGGSQISIVRNTALDSACQTLRSVYNCATGKGGDVEVKYQEIGESSPQAHSLNFICEKLALKTTGSDNQCYARCGCQTTAASSTTTTAT
ncbi:MAG: hypothetical protein HYT72_02050 [Candidatus Aenigmarchaeota archaeon]|nr:hypothetical protein [Candidatus Aenigmarchaeota archaeon]